MEITGAAQSRGRRDGRQVVPVALTDGADRRLTRRLLRQTVDALGLPATLSKRQRRQRVAATEIMLTGLRPQGTLEGLMVAQMVATHGVAMACLTRAMAADTDRAASESALRRAERLLAVYARQTETLLRIRKGQRGTDAKAAFSIDGIPFEPAPWMDMLTADARTWVMQRLAEGTRADGPTTEPVRLEGAT